TLEYATPAASGSSNGPASGSSLVAATANANAEAEWPEGNDEVRGRRRSGRSGVGRRRLISSFRGPLTVAEVKASASTPCSAARRPRVPPNAAAPAASVSQRREWSAAPLRLSSSSSTAGGRRRVQ